MLISGELKCYYCGHISGEVIANAAPRLRVLAWRGRLGGAQLGAWETYGRQPAAAAQASPAGDGAREGGRGAARRVAGVTRGADPRLQCGQCNGPVFLDEARTLSPREAATLLSPPAAAVGPLTQVGA